MLASRNPSPPAETASDDDEAHPGEARLGGLTPSLRGSSSASGAAAGGTSGNPRSNDRAGSGLGTGVGVGSTAMTKMGEKETEGTLLGFKDGKPLCGPVRPPGFHAGGVPEWSFAGLNKEEEGEEGSGDSTKAEGSQDSGFGGESYHDAEEIGGSRRGGGFFEGGDSGAGNTTPIESTEMDLYDEHGLYSSGRGREDNDDDGALHLEDAGGMGESPPAYEIHVDGEADEDGGMEFEDVMG